MEPRYGQLGLIALLAGMVVTALGCLSFVDILPGPGAVMYLGFAMVVAGAAVCYLDIRCSAGLLDDYECRLVLESAPDDGFALDLTGGEEWDAPEVTDMTEERT